MCFVCTLAVASIGAASGANTTPHFRFSGEYYLIGNEGPSINLSLGKDGTATVAEDFGNGSETLFGHWTEIGDHITIIFDAAEASIQNPPMVLQFGHYGFRAVSWNHAAWGTTDPPPVKKGAYKVKQACLFPTNP